MTESTNVDRLAVMFRSIRQAFNLNPYKERPNGWVDSDYKGDENELLVRQAANSLSALELMSLHQLGPKYVYFKPPQDEKRESHSQPSRRRRKQGKKTRGKKWN